jgi:hypothetical protein
MTLRHWLCLCALSLTTQAQAAVTVSADDIIVHMDAMPSTELTSEAAERYNITPASNRGILMVRAQKQGKTVPMQVFVGAVNSKNHLINIPMRTTDGMDGSSQLGEFYVLPADTLNFIVNINVLGKPLKAKFNRSFNP